MVNIQLVKIGKTRTSMKTCKKCGEVKEVSEFYDHKTTKDGKALTCKKCQLTKNYEWKKRNKEKVYKAQKRWASLNKEKINAYRLKSYLKQRYGVTVEWYETTLAKQKGVCAICSCSASELRGNDTSFCVDHCHTTGQPRALLCHKCNTGIGMLKDNPILVARAWTYLQQHQH